MISCIKERNIYGHDPAFFFRPFQRWEKPELNQMTSRWLSECWTRNSTLTKVVKCHKGGKQNSDGYEMDCIEGVEKCRAGGIFKWEKAKGWTNPCNHLLTCCFNGRTNTMANIFWDEYDKTVGGNVASYLPLGDSEGYTKRDDAWINIILSRNEPISAVEDSVLRRELKRSER
jgi:hypothetical protein